MKHTKRSSDIPIRVAVIAWQPPFLPHNRHNAAAGDIAVFELYDPAERRFAMNHGAGWYWWADEPVEYLVGRLAWLKRTMVREFGIAPSRIEAAFAVIPEYRRYKTDRGRAG